MIDKVPQLFDHVNGNDRQTDGNNNNQQGDKKRSEQIAINLLENQELLRFLRQNANTGRSVTRIKSRYEPINPSSIFALHIAQNGDTIPRSAKSSPPIKNAQ